MIAFIEDQRVVYGVESICRVLPIAPSIARQAIAQQSAERGHSITA
jgi:putative transposase